MLGTYANGADGLRFLEQVVSCLGSPPSTNQTPPGPKTEATHGFTPG